MKVIKVLCLMAMVCSIAACGGRDVCVQEDWLGTYSGTMDCDGTVEAVTVEVTPFFSVDVTITVIDEDEVDVEGMWIIAELDADIEEGCEYEWTASSSALQGVFTWEVELDGTNLTFSRTGSTNCTVLATKN